MQPALQFAPITLRTARQFVLDNHRHHLPPRGHKFSLALQDDAGKVVGVAIAVRPIARELDDGWTMEVTRCCTTGAKNACSMLYNAARRIAREMGYRKITTYTLASEDRKSTRLNSSHSRASRMPSSA